ncbi:MAG: hypothetical protein KF763_13045 [Cyclobacteriaceae bacterium]|nr:hypothetical protein [Cyclobacteriaceae bacterium]
MNQDTQEYLQSWRRRFSETNGNDLRSVFDRFSILFTLYNRFYNDSYRVLSNNGQLTKSRYSDFEKATSLVVLFNSADDIVTRLTENNNIVDVETVANLIDNDIFHINLANGVSQKAQDEALMHNLRSENNETKAQAVVSAIYNVRNNMQHGEKHFEEHQRLLLEPMIRILETIVTLQEEKLK